MRKEQSDMRKTVSQLQRSRSPCGRKQVQQGSPVPARKLALSLPLRPLRRDTYRIRRARGTKARARNGCRTLVAFLKMRCKSRKHFTSKERAPHAKRYVLKISSLTHARRLIANVLTCLLDVAGPGSQTTSVAASRLWYERLSSLSSAVVGGSSLVTFFFRCFLSL